MQKKPKSLNEQNSTAEELFDDLLNAMDESRLSERQIGARNAIQRTFLKLNYILNLMDRSHGRAIKMHGKIKSGTFSGLDRDYVGQTEVHAESFYCEAHRLKNLFHDRLGVPALKSTKFSRLNLIRNGIIEHPIVNKDASSWGSAIGPRLYVGEAPVAQKQPIVVDSGFYPNAYEFYAELIKALNTAVNEATQGDGS